MILVYVLGVFYRLCIFSPLSF